MKLQGIFFSTFLATCAAFVQIPPAIVYSRAGAGAQIYTGQQQPASGGGAVINSPQIIGPQIVYADGIGKAPDVKILGPQAQYTCDCARDCPVQRFPISQNIPTCDPKVDDECGEALAKPGDGAIEAMESGTVYASGLPPQGR